LLAPRSCFDILGRHRSAEELKFMKGNSVVASAAIAALSVLSSPAAARLDGAAREDFVKASVESCSSGVHKDHPKLPAKPVEAYCSCMAEAEADMTTASDVEYMSAHNAATADYSARIQALAPECAAKAGLK
jgi:hypothetical protein